MNLGAARADLQARGYNRFLAARLNAFLNTAKNRFEDYPFDWPWLKATTTGAAPLTIADLRRVRSVVDTTNQRQLLGVEAEDIIDSEYFDVALAGVPSKWYLASETSLAVFPVQASSLSVRYVKFSPELVSDSDTPLIPVRYHQTWVDLAEVEALRFGVKETATAATLEGSVLGRLGEIAGVYGMQDRPVHDQALVTGASEDW